ncbi:MAG: Gfo/Idh/MocA family protein [Actinomycetota bacterium]
MAANFALLGCAHPHSRGHLATLRTSPEVDHFWLWDPDLAAAEKLAEQAGPKLAGVTGDLSLALREEVEFALVCRPNDENPETVVAAARAGKHVLSEKPMATAAANLRPVLEEVRAAGISLGVCYPWRRHPAARDLHALIGRGVLGRLLATEARMVTSQVKFRDPSHWLFSRDRGGGGILHWLGCHYFDLLRFLTGEEVAQVTALTGTLNGYPLEVEDTAAVAMRWSSGALGTLTAGYALPRSGSGYFGAAYDTYLAARGMDGNFRWSPTRADEVVQIESVHPDWAAAPERELRYHLEPSEAYGGSYGLEFMHAFIANARAGLPQGAGGEDALRVLEWVEAVYQSARTGSSVELRVDS